MFRWIHFKLWCFFHSKELKELKRQVHCTLDLEHRVRPDLTYNDYIKRYFKDL